jgi:hypothetical protein
MEEWKGLLAACAAAASLVGCGSSSSPSTTSQSGNSTSQGGSSASQGGGSSLTGVDSFTPLETEFDAKDSYDVEVLLYDKTGVCNASSSSTDVSERRVKLKIKNADGSAVAAGTYMAGSAATADVYVAFEQYDASGNVTTYDGSVSGTITVSSITANGATGTFDVQLDRFADDDGTLGADEGAQGELSGTFDGTSCS